MLLTHVVVAAGAVLGARRVTLPPNNVNITLHGCLLDNLTQLPFCDPTKSFSDRAADLTSRLTFTEKLCLMSSTNGCAVSRLGLPAYNWGVEDDHAAGIGCINGTDGQPHCPTVFPTLSIVAATFNESLWEQVGTVIGTEMRVANNVGGTRMRDPGHNRPIGVDGWGPNLNIQRDPRWGRNSEVPGECSFLSGKVGAAMTRGIQGDPSSKFVLLLGALKHVTAYSLENWVDDTGGPRNGTKYSRFGFDGTISRHDLAETYLEQFRIAIAEGNSLGMMCSYSAINGTASCENEKLLNSWARGSAKFQGNVVTDCGALKMSSEPKDLVVSAANALNSGTDLNCGSVYSQNLEAAISRNLTTTETLDKSIQRTFELMMRGGYFDPLESQPYAAIPAEAVGTNASHQLAKEAALQGMVLLANNKNALPLKPHKVTAVLGPLANATLALGSRYYDAICPGNLNPKLPWAKGERPSGCIRSPLQQLAARGAVLHASGVVCPNDRPGDHCVGSTSQDGFAAAVAAAKQADQIVMFLGTDHSIETEGTDRQKLTLPGVQPELLAAVRAAAPSTPLTLVLLNGGAIAFDTTLADAVVETFFAGVEGGEAIACALYGERGCNRWGRLPITVFPETFAQNDMANMGVSTGGSGIRTYRYYTDEFGAPLYEFGTGLSLVPFTLAATAPPSPPQTISLTEGGSVEVAVTNVGNREGDAVVLAFWTKKGSNVSVPQGTPVPNRRLVGYSRVSLEAGAAAKVEIGITADSLGLVDVNGDTQLYAGAHEIQVSLGSGSVVSQEFSVASTAMIRELAW